MVPKDPFLWTGLTRGSLVTPNPKRRKAARGGRAGGCCGRREDSAVSIEMPQCLTAGSREGAEDHGPRPGSGPQRAAREAGRRGGGAGDPVASYLPLPRLASANSGAYTAVQRDRAELLASPGLDRPSMVREPLQPRPAAAAAFTQLAAAASAWR